MQFTLVHEIKGEIDALVDKFEAGIDPSHDAIGDIQGVLSSLRSAQTGIAKVLSVVANQPSSNVTGAPAQGSGEASDSEGSGESQE